MNALNITKSDRKLRQRLVDGGLDIYNFKCRFEKSFSTPKQEIIPMETLLRLKQAQLKQLSILLGTCMATLPTINYQANGFAAPVGTKPQLASSLLIAAKECLQKPSLSILSVDMGVRNLSVCQLEFMKSSQSVKVLDWSRLDIERDFRPTSWPASVSSFDPDRLAQIAFGLVRSKFTYPNSNILPDVILIERQRFRSTSSTSILEWTIRVNMLENMLHAALYAVSQQSENGNSWICSINPKRVISYWKQEVDLERLGGLVNNSSSKDKGRYKETKELKTHMASALLRESTSSLAFNAMSSLARDQVLSGKGKNDDLADSFLQGHAWIRWQQNRQSLQEILVSKKATSDLSQIILESFRVL